MSDVQGSFPERSRKRCRIGECHIFEPGSDQSSRLQDSVNALDEAMKKLTTPEVDESPLLLYEVRNEGFDGRNKSGLWRFKGGCQYVPVCSPLSSCQTE